MGFVGDAVGGLVGDIVNPLAENLTAQNNYRVNENYAPNIQYYSDQYGNTQGQQQNFANYLMQQAMGTGGPNPVLAQYQQNANNIALQAAGAASGQKGISPALAARMASQARGAAQQNAAGQGAMLQAQQQLNAQQAYGGQLSQMANQALTGQGQYLGALNNAQQINSGIAASNAGAVNATTMGILQGGAAAATGGASGAQKKAHGGMIEMQKQPDGSFARHLMSEGGGRIPGVASVPGDHEANDTVPILASPGEIVIPRSIAHDPDKAKKFVQHVNEMDAAKIDDFGKVLKLKAEIARKQEKLRAMCHGGRV